MDKEIFLQKLKEIENQANLSKQNLYIEFVLSNKKFKIGDTIKDKRWAFVIDKITFKKHDPYPEPVYCGFELKKDLKPKKNKNRVCIYGNDAELVKPFQQ